MSNGIALLLSITGLCVSLFCLFWTIKMRQRIKAALGGNLDSEQDLATTVTEYFKKLGATESTLSNLRQSYGHLSDIGTRSLQKIGVVRFNPFRNTGGDQSFVLALLDNHDSGVLLTSIHGREGTRVYIKSIEYGKSEHTLSAEEQSALEAATKGKFNGRNSGKKT